MMILVNKMIRWTNNLWFVSYLLIVAIGLSSCSNSSYRRLDEKRVAIDNQIYVISDSIYEEEECMCIPELDSIETAAALDKLLVSGMILTDKMDNTFPSLYDPQDLSLLPYYIISIKSPIYTSAQVQYAWDLLDVCASRYNNADLLEFGKALTYEYFNNNGDDPMILKEILGKKYSEKTSNSENRCHNPYIDSLRIRTIVNDDREALHKLEQYYNQLDKSKEIAAYYRVLLSREGNGDLAEKYVQLMKQYFSGNKFRSAVRDVLLRAALCDKNKRAQELCDSLGISLCDYRLPSSEN